MSYRGRCQPQSRSVVVAITSRSPDSKLTWLKDFLSEYFQDHISEVRYLPITNSNRSQWERDVRRCSAAILYHTKHQGRLNVTDVDGALYDEELQFLHTTLGKERVAVVLDDIEDGGDPERRRILQSQPGLARLCSQLILIPTYNKDGAALDNRNKFLAILPKAVGKTSSRLGNTSSSPVAPPPAPHTPSSQPIDIEQSERKKKSELSDINGFQIWGRSRDAASPHITPGRSAVRRYTIGIFSRAAESNYTWLVSGLKAELGTESADITGVYITNNHGQFSAEAAKYQFAILYHTLNHGRVNITDVTDSLYDQELKHLSGLLGKENVVVVADDLKNGDYDEKHQILTSQPSISKFARELFVFPGRQKSPESLRKIAEIIQRACQVFEINSCNQHKENHWPREQKHSVNQKGPDFGRKVDGTHYTSDNDRANGQELFSKSSTPRPACYQMTSPCQRDDAELPKKTRLEASEAPLNKFGNVSMLRNSEEVYRKIDSLQLVVQQLEKRVRFQEEKRESQETRITEALKTLRERETLLMNASEALVKRDRESQKTEENMKMFLTELRKREKNIIERDREIQKMEESMKMFLTESKIREENMEMLLTESKIREENMMERDRELQKVEENMKMYLRQLQKREESLTKQDKELHRMEQTMITCQTKLQIREENLMKQEEKFYNREQNMIKCLTELQRWRDYMMKREKELQKYEQNLGTCPTQLQKLEENLMNLQLDIKDIKEKLMKRGTESWNKGENTMPRGEELWGAGENMMIRNTGSRQVDAEREAMQLAGRRERCQKQCQEFKAAQNLRRPVMESKRLQGRPQDYPRGILNRNSPLCEPPSKKTFSSSSRNAVFTSGRTPSVPAAVLAPMASSSDRLGEQTRTHKAGDTTSRRTNGTWRP